MPAENVIAQISISRSEFLDVIQLKFMFISNVKLSAFADTEAMISCS